VFSAPNKVKLITFKPQRRRERREKKEILPVTLKGLVQQGKSKKAKVKRKNADFVGCLAILNGWLINTTRLSILNSEFGLGKRLKGKG
jgi:hypothetical protein